MPVPTSRVLQPRLTSFTRRTDLFIAHLSRVLASSQGVEVTLCTLCYALTLLHAFLSRLHSLPNARLTEQSIAIKTHARQPLAHKGEIAAGIKALADLIDDFCIFTRLWGLLDIYTRVRETHIQPPHDAIIKTLVWAELGLGAIFQVLENAAYLAGKGVLRGKQWRARAGKWSAYSNRFWMAQVLVAVLRLGRVRQLKWEEDLGAQKMGQEEDDKIVKAESAELRRRWVREMWVNVGWFPATLHWSLEDQARSPVGEALLGLAGLVPGLIGVEQVWTETAT